MALLLLLLTMTKLYVPLPATADEDRVVSAQAPVTTAPAVPSELPAGGPLAQVMAVSVQVLVVALICPPTGLGSVTHSRSLAAEIWPPTPLTTKRR